MNWKAYAIITAIVVSALVIYHWMITEVIETPEGEVSKVSRKLRVRD